MTNDHRRDDDDYDGESSSSEESSSCAASSSSSSIVGSESESAGPKSPIHDRKVETKVDVKIPAEEEEEEVVMMVAEDEDLPDNELDEVSLDGAGARGVAVHSAVPSARDDATNSEQAAAGDESHGSGTAMTGTENEAGPTTEDTADDVNGNVKIGFSFSPGGLLFAYHLGVLASLTDRGYVTETTPLAGSSAGGIAVATYAAGVNPYDAIASCIRIAEECSTKWGGARGRLLPLLERELDLFLPEDAHEIVNARPGLTGIAYREVFPQPKSVLATHFDSREDFIEAICNSSAFPFFTSNNLFVIRKPRGGGSSSRAAAPAPPTATDGEAGISATAPDDVPTTKVLLEDDNAFHVTTERHQVPPSSSCSSISNVSSSSAPDPSGAAEPRTISPPENEQTPPPADPGAVAPRRRRFPGLGSIPKSLPRLPSADNLPRLVVDGFFSTSRDRFGCPSFPPGSGVNRTITVSVFPHHVVGLNASEERDRICPTVRSGQRGLEVMSTLLRKAGIPSSAHEYVDMYECGRVDADRWVAAEMERNHAAEAANRRAGGAEGR